MALQTVFIKKENGQLTLTPDPVVVEEGDKIVWFSKEEGHEGNFESAPPTDKRKWSALPTQPSSPVLRVVVKKGRFPYKVNVAPKLEKKSEVVVVET